jgi:hypothetical protein
VWNAHATFSPTEYMYFKYKFSRSEGRDIMNNPIIVTILFACSSLHAAPQAPVTANTEAPVLLKGAGVAFAMPEEEYRKIAEQLSKNPKFVPMKRKPAGLTAGAKFGFNLAFGGLNRSWVLMEMTNKGMSFMPTSMATAISPTTRRFVLQMTAASTPCS